MYFLNWYLLFLILPLIYLFLIKKRRKSIKFSRIEKLKIIANKNRYKVYLGKFLIFIGLVFLILAISRPYNHKLNSVVDKNGIDIMLVLDISGSMQSIDLLPNRLEAAKKVILNFAKKRVNDRIGLVLFAGSAYTKLPLTFDSKVVEETISKIDFSDIKNNNQTAIGLGITVALNRLKTSESKSKIIILATDGSNNAGEISPEMSLNFAKEMGVRIYSVGVGSDDTIFNIGGIIRRGASDLDEELLMKISKETKGKYFRADDLKRFNEIFDQIDELEKTKIEDNVYSIYKELYKIFLRLSLVFLFIGLLIDKFLMIKIPE